MERNEVAGRARVADEIGTRDALDLEFRNFIADFDGIVF